MTRYDLPPAQKKHILRECIATFATARALAHAVGKDETTLSRQASPDHPEQVPTWPTLVAASMATGDGTLLRLLGVACGLTDEAARLDQRVRLAARVLAGDFESDGAMRRALETVEESEAGE